MGFSRQEYWSGVPLPSLPIHRVSLKEPSLVKGARWDLRGTVGQHPHFRDEKPKGPESRSKKQELYVSFSQLLKCAVQKLRKKKSLESCDGRKRSWEFAAGPVVRTLCSHSATGVKEALIWLDPITWLLCRHFNSFTVKRIISLKHLSPLSPLWRKDHNPEVPGWASEGRLKPGCFPVT